MSEKTHIQWTDATWNAVTGCTKISPGCAHCYAERITERFHGPGSFDKIVLHPDRLEQPLHWKKPRRVFVNSMSDLFHEDVPSEFIDRVFAVMALCQQHSFQVLTKRPERMREEILRISKSIDPLEKAAQGMGHTFQYQGIPLLPWPIGNVWLGVSVENQHFADERIPLLLQTPAAVRFISAEPLLAPVDLGIAKGLPLYREAEVVTDRMMPSGQETRRLGFTGWLKHSGNMHPWLDWVICGGESGIGARPMDIKWARSLRDQCKAAGAAFFCKQLGGVRDKRGKLEDLPADLRVREWPASPLPAEPKGEQCEVRNHGAEGYPHL